MNNDEDKKSYHIGDKTELPQNYEAMDVGEEARNHVYLKGALISLIEEHDHEPLLEMIEDEVPLHKFGEWKELVSDLIKGNPIRGKRDKRITRTTKGRQLEAAIRCAELLGVGTKEAAVWKEVGDMIAKSPDTIRKKIWPDYKDRPQIRAIYEDARINPRHYEVKKIGD